MNQNTRRGQDGKGDGRKNTNTPAAQPGKTTSKDSGKNSDEFGREGTNKTIAEPKADGAPSEELGNTPHVGKSPYTRG